MVTINTPDIRLTPAYKSLFQELSNTSKYATYSVAEFYCDRKSQPSPDTINVVLRVDVDDGLHLAEPLALALKHYNINASHYFLTDPELHYDLWGSDIPKKIALLGQEVGIHSDHYYKQLTNGSNGLEALKKDIKRLSDLCAGPVRGMTHHGHDAMTALGRSNWELIKGVEASELGLEYHEGLNGPYIQPGAAQWEPKCDLRISDYLGFSNSWGWNYYPAYPLRCLKKAKPGDIVHMAFHTKSAFTYWKNWTKEYGEPMQYKEKNATFLKKSLIIRWRHQLLRGKKPGWIAFHSLVAATSYFLAKGVGLFWKNTQATDPDTTWETSRQKIYDYGLPYWEKELSEFGLDKAKGTVVEVGSGNGQWLLAFAKEADEVIGVEPNEKVREYAEEKIREHADRSKKITLHASSAENLPIDDEVADIVLCAGVFMFTQQHKALAEMVRVLKPGGTICITANGLGYFLMYILNGFRHRNVQKMRYGLAGFLATLYKWSRKKTLSKLTSAVSHNEMERLFNEQGLTLCNTKLWQDKLATYPKEHMGFATNYAFIATKNAKED